MGDWRPIVPVPGTYRARQLATQRADDARGRFFERFPVFAFDAIDPQDSQDVECTVMSQGARHTRYTAMRGSVVGSTEPLRGNEAGVLRLRLQLNGTDFIGDGNGNHSASFASLFGSPKTPWFWFDGPLILRAGDELVATVTNTLGLELASLTPELVFRTIDERLYRQLYNRAVMRGGA